MTQLETLFRRPWLPVLIALAVLLVAYVPLLQTIPNGADHYYMIDVGETQIVLNTWGTLHPTGYPLYVISGNILVAGLRALGIGPALAPGIVSLLWGGIALGLLGALMVHLTDRRWLAAGAIILLGLTRTVWVHHVIAEMYTSGLAVLALLLLLALWKAPVSNRVCWLAVIGGIGVGHHRGIAMAAPALIAAAWPDVRRLITGNTRQRLSLIGCGLLGVIGLIGPYLYLYLRAQAGADWVYGDPSTLAGVWEQFRGAEGTRFIGLPENLAAFRANLDLVNGVLITDLTWPGLLAGVIGLITALRQPDQRRAAVAMLLSGGVAYAFHALLYSDVLSALILPVIVSVAFGWLFLADDLLRLRQTGWQRVARWGWAPLAVLLAIALIMANGPFIHDLVTDTEGLDFIKLAGRTPPDSTLMLAWGVHYFALGFAQDVDPALAPEALQQVRLVPHDVDFYNAAQGETLITPAYTFYNQPPAWWEVRLGQLPVLQAAAPNLVQIGLEPGSVADPPDAFGPADADVICEADTVILDVTWYTPDAPTEDLSVFVHAWSADGDLLGQADQSAPVYGWRPLTGWQAGEAVRDVYALAVDPAEAAEIKYGFYRVVDGAFENVYEYAIPVDCG
jgi:hypothetical protein